MPLAHRCPAFQQPSLWLVEGCDGVYRKVDMPPADWDGKSGLVARMRVYGANALGIFKRAEDIEQDLSDLPGWKTVNPLKLPLCDACGEPSLGSVIRGDAIYCWNCIQL